MFEKLLRKLEVLEPLVDITNDSDISSMATFLYDRIAHPDSYLVFLGETSSGKSSLVNGLLGSNILPMKATPSTATITEVELYSQATEDAYYAINKNATIEKIDKKAFSQLSEHPDDKLKRLKVVKSGNFTGLDNLRIFDTPGYGSIIKEHDEVLKDFLPNSDIIVYTVSYRIGIQEEDYLFLSYLKELIRSDVKIFLLVNRCPIGIGSNDTKIHKIKNLITDILSIEPEIFTVENITAKDGEDHVLPKCENLWKSVSKVLSASQRIESLNSAFESYIKDLYNACSSVVEKKYIAAKINADNFESVVKLQEETAYRIKSAIRKFLDPTFDRIERALPQKISEVRCNVERQVLGKIEKSSCTSKEEMVAYCNSHLLPHTIKVETQEIQNYIDVKLDDLNREVDDYLQKELIRFNNQLSVKINTQLDATLSSLGSNILKAVGTNSLRGYFSIFGGMGGANAGIANAASHILKETGNLFGHTFSRATHNGVKHFLSKIGATSMKTVGATVAVITEFAFTAYDLATWKGKLSGKIKESLDQWQKRTYDEVKEDLKKLREENEITIRKIANDIAHSFDSEKPKDIEKCQEEYLYAKKIGIEIGIE